MVYRTILTGGQAEIEVKKSRFIAQTSPVCSEQEALDFLASARKKYWDAKHNCYAYTIGPRFELQRSSDDGEPGGTAGRPILELLLGEEIHDSIIVVTRYFGGTLLGTGGLIRAYQESAREGLAHSEIIERKTGRKYTIRTDFGSLGKLQYLIAKSQIPVLDTRYTDVVEMDLIVPSPHAEQTASSDQPEQTVSTGYTAQKASDFLDKVSDATSGSAEIMPGEEIGYAQAGDELILYGQES